MNGKQKQQRKRLSRLNVKSDRGREDGGDEEEEEEEEGGGVTNCDCVCVCVRSQLNERRTTGSIKLGD
jgi:hypothetical protein